MTPALAQFLTVVTILAAGAVVATVLISLVPARFRTLLPVLGISTLSITSVAFGTEIADNLPDRIVARHAAGETMARLRADIPELDELQAVDQLVDYEITSAFHTAYMTDIGPASVRAERAGYAVGLVAEQALLRNLPRITDGSARQLIALERQIFETLAKTDSAICSQILSAGGAGPDLQAGPDLAVLRRSLLRAKLRALIDAEDGLATFSPGDRRAFEARLIADATMSARAAPRPLCDRMADFYARLEQQPTDRQGMWIRSRQMIPVNG